MATGFHEEMARLYALPPDEFIKARDAAARAAGDADMAAALKSLRKPSKAASLANLLAREDPAAATALVELGEQLRRAQQELDGGRMRTLSQQRRELVRDLHRKVEALSDESVSDAIGRQLDGIFQAAVAGAGAGAAFAGARISGLPEGDEQDPFAGVPTSPRPARKTPSKAPASRENRQGELRAARATEREAAAASRTAQAAAKKVRARLLDRTSALQRLEEEMNRTRAQISDLRKEVRAAEHAADLAEKKHDEARARYERLSGADRSPD
ncbi:MAG TPA: hypothetical protein VHC49_25130 [Mycobacteriales bacterium]|nr:hypothetical protein [Mycobacteriales bacterium]